MYQIILRDLGGGSLVRVATERVVVNGSVLMVPADCVAYMVHNGEISPPFGPGNHAIHTGVSPFFVRLHNLMTRGEAPESLTAFCINTVRDHIYHFGTGEIAFQEKRFLTTLRPMASVSLRYRAEDPLRLLKVLIGMDASEFDEEDYDAKLGSVLRPMTVTALKQYLSRRGTLGEVHGDLTGISARLTGLLRPTLGNYGIRLRACSVEGIHFSDEDLQAIRSLEQQYAQGITQTTVEEDNMSRIYGGRMNRMLAEALTSSNLTPPMPGQPPAPPQGGSGSNIASLFMQMYLLQNTPWLRQLAEEMAQQANIAQNNPGSTGAQQAPSAGDTAPRPVSHGTPRCTCRTCGRTVWNPRGICPHCGSALT